ncbi:EamA family transporter, partial [Lacisediminihabitans profunda]
MTTTSDGVSTAGRLSTPVFAAIVVTVLAWASAFVVIRGVAPHFGGGARALRRRTVGASLLS